MASPDRIEILEKAYSDLVGERDRLRDARAGFTARLGPLPAAAAIASASPPAGRGAAARGGTESHEAVTISGMALLVGAVIDGIPENAALGVSLLASDSSVGVVLLAAIFLANVPESISGAVGMRAEGRSRGYVFTVWGWHGRLHRGGRSRLCASRGASDHLIAAILAWRPAASSPCSPTP